MLSSSGRYDPVGRRIELLRAKPLGSRRPSGGITNAGGSFASNFVITDPIPANTDIKVGSESHTTPLPTGLTFPRAPPNSMSGVPSSASAGAVAARLTMTAPLA